MSYLKIGPSTDLFFIRFSEYADGDRRGLISQRSRRDASLGTFRSALVLGVRRRRAPTLIKKVRDSRGGRTRRPGIHALAKARGERGIAAEEPAEGARRPLALALGPRIHARQPHRAQGVFRYLGACRRRTAEDLCRSEGTGRRVSPRYSRCRPRIRASPRHSAVGMLRKYDENRSTLRPTRTRPTAMPAGWTPCGRSVPRLQ